MIVGKLSIGLVVGCEYRWPMSANHPDCWQPPLKGVVLALDDPRAWSGTLAFPQDTPDQSAVTKWVEHCLSQDGMKDTPVLYSDGDKKMVRWETTDKLHPWEEELRRWTQARKDAYESRRRELATAS